MIKSLSIVLMATMLVAWFVPHGEAVIGCSTVIGQLGSCVPYLTDRGPLAGCCTGVKGLYGMAHTTPDRQSVCNCLKTLSGQYPGLNLNKAAGLPKQCGVNIPYEIRPSIDCSTVH